MPEVGEEGRLDWIAAGALGALMCVGDEALLSFLGSFVAFLAQAGGDDINTEEVLKYSQAFLIDYKRYLKEQGVANV